MNQLMKVVISLAVAVAAASIFGALFHCSGDTQIILVAVGLFGIFNTREAR